MKSIAIISFLILFIACSPKQVVKENEWITAYKNTACIACMSEVQECNKNDISNAINFDLIGNTFYFKQADSLGKLYGLAIKPSPNMDYEGRKIITNSCLEFYNSKKLDSISQLAYKNYLAHQ